MSFIADILPKSAGNVNGFLPIYVNFELFLELRNRISIITDTHREKGESL